MYSNGWMGFLHHITEWIVRLLYVNFMWILFTAVGLVVAGVFPATVGMYTVIRQWLTKGIDTVPIWKTFWDAYRKEFIKSNIVGYVFLLIGFVLIADLKLIQMQESIVFTLLTYITLLVFIIYMLMWVYLFPVFVHYDLKGFQYLKQTFLIVMLRPIDVLIVVSGIILIFLLMYYMPILIVLFGASTLALISMWIALHSFRKLQKK